VDGNRVYYRAEVDNPIFGDLRGLLLRTAGLKDVLAGCLARFRSRIDVAFVYGSVARGDESASSDVDLMVIGGVGLSELAPALKDAEARLLRKRSVNSIFKSRREVGRMGRSDPSHREPTSWPTPLESSTGPPSSPTSAAPA
jgi:predicted nucleotidyltransferase